MKSLGHKYGNLMLFMVAAVVLMGMPAEVWAAEGNIFSTIRSRAAQALKDYHQVVYLLAGFGLIGFAFMAVFNKISWKWFANIAIGLFLVAVMGMIISYFTGDDQIARELSFGYDMGTNTQNPGTPGGGGGGGGNCSTDSTLPGCDGRVCPDGQRWINGMCKSVNPDS